jgi:putative hydrolase of the HAD superfamily
MPEKFENIRAVIFDLGDTLIHGNFTAGATGTIWEEIYRQLINPAQASAIPELARLREAWQEHVQSAMARTWSEKTEQELEFMPLVQQAFRAAGMPQAEDPQFLRQVISLEHRLIYERVVSLAPDALSTLRELHRRGYRLGLVSNFCNLPEVAYENIGQVGLLEFFDQTILSCEIGWRKPAQFIYREMLNRLGVPPEAALFVGDRLIEDVQGPQKLGMKAVQSKQFRQEAAHPEIKPDAVIDRLEQLLGLLAQAGLDF